MIFLTGNLFYMIGFSTIVCRHILFDALLRKNIYGLKKRIFNINNDLIMVMCNCFEIVNGPMWISWANSLYTVSLYDSHHVSHITLLLFIYYYIYIFKVSKLFI